MRTLAPLFITRLLKTAPAIVVDAAHRLHSLRGQADLVAGDLIRAYYLSDIDLLHLIGCRKIRNTLDRVKVLSVPMLRHKHFGGRCDIGAHLVCSVQMVEWHSLRKSGS